MWVLGLKLGSSSLVESVVYLLRQLTNHLSCFNIKYIHLCLLLVSFWGTI